MADQRVDQRHVGPTLTAWRQRRQRTLNDLAFEAGCSTDEMRSIEGGHPADPRRLAQIAKVLGISVQHLLAGRTPDQGIGRYGGLPK